MAAFAFTLVSCGSGGDNSATDTDTSGPGTPGVQNANGNMPDTTNAMNLSTSDSTAHHTQDSLSKGTSDTANKKK